MSKIAPFIGKECNADIVIECLTIDRLARIAIKICVSRV